MRDGVGTQQFQTGENYKGEWLADKMHGTGTIVYPNGDCFEGQWEDGKRVHGTLTIPMPNTPDMPNKKMEYRGLFTNSMPGMDFLAGRLCLSILLINFMELAKKSSRTSRRACLGKSWPLLWSC